MNSIKAEQEILEIFRSAADDGQPLFERIRAGSWDTPLVAGATKRLTAVPKIRFGSMSEECFEHMLEMIAISYWAKTRWSEEQGNQAIAAIDSLVSQLFRILCRNY
jgi:hypothetical protein